jgi:hypothetical protein
VVLIFFKPISVTVGIGQEMLDKKLFRCKKLLPKKKANKVVAEPC